MIVKGGLLFAVEFNANAASWMYSCCSNVAGQCRNLKYFELIPGALGCVIHKFAINAAVALLINKMFDGSLFLVERILCM